MSVGWLFPIVGCDDDCECDCEVFADDFDRANSSDLGSAWEEVAGDWSIASNAAVCDSADGHLLSTATFSQSSIVLEAQVKLTANDDVAMVYLGADQSNHLLAEVQAKEDLIYLRLGQRAGGAVTWLTNPAAQAFTFQSANWGRGEAFIVRLCYAAGVLQANTYDAAEPGTLGQFAEAEVTLATPYKLGLATGTQSGATEFLSVSLGTCEECTKRCSTVSDDFNRAALGDDWTVNSGTFTVAADEVSTSSTGALLLCNSKLSGIGAVSQIADFNVRLRRNSNARVVLAWNSAADHIFATLSLNSTGTTLAGRIYHRTSGMDLQVGGTSSVSLPSVTEIYSRFRYCLNSPGEGPGVQTLEGQSLGIYVVGGTNNARTGKQLGFGTYGSSAQVDFDAISYALLGSSTAWPTEVGASITDCQRCRPNCAQCGSSLPPLAVLANIPAGLTDGGNCEACSESEGEFELISTGNCCWYYRGPVICTLAGMAGGCTAGRIGLSLCLAGHTPSLGMATWTLRLTFGDGCAVIDPTDPNYVIEWSAVVAMTGDWCAVPPPTLTRTSGSFINNTANGPMCTGTIPETVSLGLP